MPRKPVGLLKRKITKPLSKKEVMAAYNRDTGKSSLRKANEVPGAANKMSNNRGG